MEQSNQSKKVLLSVIGVAILVVAVVGVSFAFFNYTRTGGTNTVTTGNIQFSTTNAGVAIENMFPITVTGNKVATAELGYTNEAVVYISGNTTYNGGIDYKVFVTDLNNEVVSEIDLPISVLVTTSGFGANAPTTYNRTAIANNQLLAQGNIPAQTTLTNAEIHIRAYLDANQIAITDTLVDDPVASGETYTNGTTGTPGWLRGRTRLTTQQWNSISTSETAVSFRVTVEAIQHGGTFINNPTS